MMLSTTKFRQSGLSLIELMIAITLGLLIMAAVIQLFVNNKQTYRITESQTQMQDNARFSMNYLSKDIRLAGYSGCRAINKINVQIIADAPVPATMSPDTVITGTENWGAGVISATLGEVQVGSDVLSIQRASSCGGTLTENTSNTEVKVNAPNSCNLQSGEVLMISDCEDAHIFRATTVSNGTNKQTITHANNMNQANRFCTAYSTLPQAGNCDTGKTKLYGYDAELYKFVSASYFIRESVNGVPALWVYDATSATTPGDNPKVMVEGISDMQIEYGIDDNDDDIIDRYTDAQTITDAIDWSRVISAEVSLLVQTAETNLTLNNQSLTYNGTTITGTDGRIRRVFVTTIGVRNRVQ